MEFDLFICSKGNFMVYLCFESSLWLQLFLKGQFHLSDGLLFILQILQVCKSKMLAVLTETKSQTHRLCETCYSARNRNYRKILNSFPLIIMSLDTKDTVGQCLY